MKWFAWMCECGNGSLKCDEVPEFCDICGMNLWDYFFMTDEEG